MNRKLPYVDAIRDFHPDRFRPPLLNHPIRRAAYPALVHFAERDQGEILRIAEGLDDMYHALENDEETLNGLLREFYSSADDKTLALTNGIEVPIAFYEHFVCARVDTATLVDALLVHALGAASLANALSHQIEKSWWPESTRYLELAERTTEAQELAHAAELYRHGVRVAEWGVRSQSRKAAVSRHEPAQAIKERFIEFYKNGQHRSKADAARKYFDSLSDQEQTTITPSRDKKNAERTLTAALRRHQQ